MTFLADKLRERIQVLLPVNTPDDTIAGYVRTYQIQTTVWGESNPITSSSKGIAAFAAYVRGTEVSEFGGRSCIRRSFGPPTSAGDSGLVRVHFERTTDRSRRAE